ncbi:bestrophin family protein [Cytophaga aurantiaca]|uniref:bestrophin family protein n=1 Tax=Cytophaga aurantiaca TaxID=29530 RepID=UPI00036AF896|nr:bestrophin family ion channel [Cytophaga aurantiaca]
MIVKFRFVPNEIFEVSKYNLIYSLTIVFFAVILKVTNYYIDWGVPVSITAVLGTALSILLGFSNSQAYDRWWEARKIWGSIVNDSRSFSKQVISFIQFEDDHHHHATKEIRRKIIYRHLAFINALRMQLREEQNAEKFTAVLSPFLSEEEYNTVRGANNVATQLIKNQAEDIRKMYDRKLLNEFMFIQLDQTLSNFYTYQGQAERIKKTPFLPTYHFFSKVFLYFFITLLPFSLLSGVDKAATTWILLPITVAIGWVFHIIYLNGHVYATPFDNTPFDTPMTSICNTIEIDLKEMLGGDEVMPAKMVAHKGILM